MGRAAGPLLGHPAFTVWNGRGSQQVELRRGIGDGARVIIEKPFGTRSELGPRVSIGSCMKNFPESAIFRIDHYLGKRPVNNMIVLPLRECFMEPFWNRNYIESVQITMAEDFGVQGRGGFYDKPVLFET